MIKSNNIWQVKVVKEFERNLVKVPEGSVLRVKDKFPDNNGDCEKGVWEIKSPYGDLFSMNFEERKEFLEEIGGKDD